MSKEEKFVITSIDEAVIMLNTLGKQLAELKAENERLNKDCEKKWLEIHGEGGYLQQLKEKDETIKQQENHIVGQNVINNELKKKLKEKDEELAKLEKAFNELDDVNTKLILRIKSNTKQVCEKIREYIKENYYKQLDDRYIEQLVDVVQTKGLEEFLDQIEKNGTQI